VKLARFDFTSISVMDRALGAWIVYRRSGSCIKSLDRARLAWFTHKELGPSAETVQVRPLFTSGEGMMISGLQRQYILYSSRWERGINTVVVGGTGIVDVLCSVFLRS